MLKKTFSINCVVLSCVLLAILFVEGGYSKRFKPAKNHPNRESSNVPKRPDDNGEFEVYYTTPGGKRIGCTGLFSVEGKEEVANIFVEDNRGRQRINTSGLSMALRQSFLPNFSAIAETIRRYAFLPVICLLPVLKPIAGVLGMNLDVDLLNMDNILSFNVNASTGIEVEASASFACPRGPPGPPGRAGFIGPPGFAGPPGPDGTNGTNGNFGRKGPPGEMGPPGLLGLVGYPGLQGTIGLPGPIGPPGEDGRDGRDGLPGSPGSRGSTGADGAYGADGTNGRDGRTGPQGPPGGQGAQGLPGKPGLPGTPGPNGIPGASGINGRPGLPGIPALDGLNAVCPGAPFYAMNSDIPSKPGSDGCSFIEVNKKELLKGSVTIGGGGGGGGGDVLSGPGGSGGSAQGVGIADAGSTGLGFYICNSKNLTFTISIDNNSDTIAINDSKTAEEEYGEKFPMNFDDFQKSSGKVKVNVDAEGLINITPLGKTEDMYTFTRHSGVRPRSGFPIY